MESNKLIAEFMGVNVGEYTSYPEESPTQYTAADLEYDTSWDWLMPVVAKITRDIRWRGNKYREYLMDIVPLGNIEYAYSAVVEFIKECNKYSNNGKY